MKYLKEIAIIFGITMTGELLNQWIPFPVPAGVYGLFILLGLLCSGAVKLQDVQATGNLLLDLMPLMFIPSAVGLIEKFDELKAILVPFFVITVVSTLVVMTTSVETTVMTKKGTRMAFSSSNFSMRPTADGMNIRGIRSSSRLPVAWTS